MQDPRHRNEPHPLDESWPAFLNRLDSHPRRAFEEFHEFVSRMLVASPPRVLARFPEANREDFLHDLILYCCKENFRVLRTYEDRGGAFAVWLHYVVRNRALDHLRRLSRRGNFMTDQPGFEDRTPDARPSEEESAEHRQLLETVRACLEEMDEESRLLLIGASEGRKPRELTRLLGWPADWNKKASDKLRECRRKLRRALESRGIREEDLEGLLGRRPPGGTAR